MLLESEIPYRMKYVIVKLCLYLISLFQPIDQMLHNNLFTYLFIVLITIVSIF